MMKTGLMVKQKLERLSYVLFLCLFFIGIVSSFLPPAIAQEQGRWWQREDFAPSYNQVINPAYLSKKQELEQAWDQYQEHIRADKHFRSMGQRTPAIRGMIRETEEIIRQLEAELSQIPMYITRQP